MDRSFVSVLLLAHAPLYSQEVLVGPWAMGTLVGQLWAMRWPLPAPLATWSVALLYGLCGLRALITPWLACRFRC